MMSRSPESERTILLVERAQADDAEALEHLFARFLPRVRSLVAVRLRRSTAELLDVDDVTQEAVADAFRGFKSLSGGSDGAICHWLSKIVENRIRMALRERRAQKRGGGRERRFADATSEVRNSQLPGDHTAPSTGAERGELSERVQLGLRAVSEQHREVLLQRVYCRLTFAEIASNLELRNADAVRTIYARALLELREHTGLAATAGCD